MGVLKFLGFAGMWPIRDPQVLPENAAAEAVNVRLEGGGYLKGRPLPFFVQNLSAATNYARRLPATNTPGADIVAGDWAQFANADTNVVRGPVTNDTFERVYWCSPTTGLRVATRQDTINGVTGFLPGVPTNTVFPPLIALVSGSGATDPTTGENTGNLQTRSYLVTYINQWGEESAPSKSAEAVGYHDQTWRITPQAPILTGGPWVPIVTIRIYRTVTGENGATGFYKVVDVPIANAGAVAYSDTLLDLTVTGQGTLPSTNWETAPTGLQGIAAMPNGIILGWKGQTVYFSENYRPHAWPSKYAVSVAHPIVGVAVFGSSAVICTSGPPSVVTGVKSKTMSLNKTDAALPCVSRASIVAAPFGVFYASEDGLVVVEPKGIALVTQDYIGRDQWRFTYKPWTQRAMYYNGRYIALYGGAGDTGFSFFPGDPNKEGVIHYTYSPTARNIGVDETSGQAWKIGSDSKLYELSRPDQLPDAYIWRSRPSKLPYPQSFSCYQAYFDSSSFQPPHLKVWVTLRGNIADTPGHATRTLVYDSYVPLSGVPVPLPSGFKSDVWEVELTGTTPVETFVLATSPRELRGA